MGIAIGLAAVSAAFSGACGDSQSASNADGAPGKDGASDGRSDVRSSVPDAGVTDATPGTPVGPGSKLLIPGAAMLVGHGGDSCTRQTPAATDRWCAVALPSNFLGNTDLWVVNVTQALAGKAVQCGRGRSTNCVRLSTDLFAGDLTMHAFTGDTLIYYAESNSNQNFIGTVFAWRPEWQTPHALTTQTGLFCDAHPTQLAAMCIQNPAGNAANETMLDITAGKLSDADGTLPVVDTILYAAPGDPQNVTKTQFELSPDGQAVLWSSRATAKGPEILRMQTLNDAASKRVVAQDVAQWRVTPDSKNWYWLSGFNYSTSGATSGTLQMAPYPAGTAPATLATGAGDYAAAGNKSLFYRSGVKLGVGALKTIVDVNDAAGTTKQLDSAALRIWAISQDGTAIMYSKTSDDVGQLFDLFLHSTDKTAACALASTPVALGFGNLAGTSRNAAWVKVTDMNNTGAFYTAFDTCMSRKFASNILSLDTIGDQGYVYLDDGDEMGVEGTLRFNQAMNGQVGTTGHVLQTHSLPTAAVLWPAHAAVLYTISTQGSTDGLYFNDTLPFTGLVPPPGPADAGTPSDTGAAEPAVEPAGSDAGTGSEASGADASAD